MTAPRLDRLAFAWMAKTMPARTWTLQGDAQWGSGDYHVGVPSLAAPPSYVVQNDSGIDTFGANFLGRSETTLNPDSTLRLQAYYDFVQRVWAIEDTRTHTVDFELHHTWSGWSRQQIDSGLGYRFVDEPGGQFTGGVSE